MFLNAAAPSHSLRPLLTSCLEIVLVRKQGKLTPKYLDLRSGVSLMPGKEGSNVRPQQPPGSRCFFFLVSLVGSRHCFGFLRGHAEEINLKAVISYGETKPGGISVSL